MDAQHYDDAIVQYSAALALDPAFPQVILVRRSKAYVAKGLWGDALEDANRVRCFCLRSSRLSDAKLSGDNV